MFVDGNSIYTSSTHLFEIGLTKVDLKWDTHSIGKLALHDVFAEARFYDKTIKSSESTINTFLSTQTAFISNVTDVQSFTDDTGHVIAVSNTLYSSHLHKDGVQ